MASWSRIAVLPAAAMATSALAERAWACQPPAKVASVALSPPQPNELGWAA
jgi:hypothetical protein